MSGPGCTVDDDIVEFQHNIVPHLIQVSQHVVQNSLQTVIKAELCRGNIQKRHDMEVMQAVPSKESSLVAVFRVQHDLSCASLQVQLAETMSLA